MKSRASVSPAGGTTSISGVERAGGSDVTPGAHRVLVLIVDGLRYETALDSTVMPNLQRLRTLGASGKLETVFEGFSVPAIKAAFTGTAETQLVNVVRNFRFSSLPIESVFLDAERANKRVLIVGDEPFRQFGTRAERRIPAGQANMYAEDAARPAMALGAWEREAFDVVVCHYETTDWRAHEYGIVAPEYRVAFAKADSIVAAFASARRDGDYLLVFGDHGHNAAGEHKTGIYIPSFALMLGPDVKANASFASLDIGNVRLLMSHALGIPLRLASYQASTVASFLPLLQPGRESVRADSALRASATMPDSASVGLSSFMPILVFMVAGSLLFIAVGKSASDQSRLQSTVVLLVIAELVLQLFAPVFSLLPLLLIALGATIVSRSRLQGVTVIAIGIFLLSRWSLSADALTLRIPTSMWSLVPLYVAGTAARFAMLLMILGRRRWPVAAVLAGVLTIVCVRVWDIPALSIGSIVVAGVLAFIARRRADDALCRAALVTVTYLLLYYTVRLPIYQLFWIDLFLIAVMFCHQRVAAGWFDLLVLSGSFTLTSLWLSTGLEWGFLYDLMPAYTLEHHVVWFLPLIALKIPLLLLLIASLVAWRPGKSFVLLALTYIGVRFVGAWVARLAGANTGAVWPVVEQGLYLVPFAFAGLVLRRIDRGTSAAVSSQMPDDREHTHRLPRPKTHTAT